MKGTARADSLRTRLLSPSYFRLSRRADRDALDERTGAAFRFESPDTFWGKVMLDAKAKNQIVIPEVDCCTAWCAVKQGLGASPMREPPDRAKLVKGQPLFRPALAQWALVVSRAFAQRYLIPYFELALNDETADLSLLEWLVTMGGIDVKIARAAVDRYSKARRGDPTRLSPTDIMRLSAAADGREAALAEEAPAPAQAPSKQPLLPASLLESK